jgi:hypothetical protein
VSIQPRYRRHHRNQCWAESSPGYRMQQLTAKLTIEIVQPWNAKGKGQADGKNEQINVGRIGENDK